MLFRSIRAVKLIVGKMADAVIEANQGEAFVAQEAVETDEVSMEEIASEEN